MKTTLTISDDLWWQFQEAIARRRTTQKEALEEAIASYITVTSRPDHAAKAASALTKIVHPASKRKEQAG